MTVRMPMNADRLREAPMPTLFGALALAASRAFRGSGGIARKSSMVERQSMVKFGSLPAAR